MSVGKESEDRVWQRSSNFITREIAGEILLIPVGAQTKVLNGMITFTDTGAFVWKHLDGKRDVTELARLLAAECGETVETVQPDVESFLQKAFEQGLLVKA